MVWKLVSTTDLKKVIVTFYLTILWKKSELWDKNLQ